MHIPLRVPPLVSNPIPLSLPLLIHTRPNSTALPPSSIFCGTLIACTATSISILYSIIYYVNFSLTSYIYIIIN